MASGHTDAMMKVMTDRPEVIVLGYLEPRGEIFKVYEQLKKRLETTDIPQVVIDVAPEELGEVIEKILAKVKVTDVI